MTTSDRVSAEIIQFPARGRFAAVGQDRSVTPQLPQRVAKAVFGSGWYHDEAIEEAERAGER